MINDNLLEIVTRAEGSKVALDLALLLVVFGFLMIFFRRNTLMFTLLLTMFVIIYSTNEILSTQTTEVQRIEGEGGESIVREVVVENRSTSPFTPGFHAKLLMSVPLIFTGVVQAINMMRGDRRYMLTKSLSTNLVIQGPLKTTYRSYLTSELPRKVIFVCQHLPYLFDTLVFHTFIPDTHRYTVFNDFTMGGMSKPVASVFHNLYCKHLYGAHKFSRRDKSTMKTQLLEFIDMMTARPEESEIFCIWPSGWAWRNDHPNGVERFKPGVFFMSMYTGIPICLVHGRLSKDNQRFTVEQSELIHPPLNPKGTDGGYLEFYEDPVVKADVERYRVGVENFYRETDDRLEKEVNKNKK